MTSDFTLTPTALKVVRNLAGLVSEDLIARALGCSRYQLERIAQQHCISLKRDDQAGVR